MQLNEQIKQELQSAIKSANERGSSFPFETTFGVIKHTISKEKLSAGHLISTLEVDKKQYLIYLV